jgi:capping protein (actin filament) muscle Z-line, alpha
MAEEEVMEATPEEKLHIAQHYLLSSPPGQINDVLVDVRKLVPEGLLTDDLTRAIFRTYNTEQYKIVDSGERRMLVSLAGEVDATHYIDTAAGEVVGFDHVKQEVIAGDRRPVGGEMDSSLEDKRAALQRHVQGYLDRQYERSPDGKCTGVCAVYAKEGKLQVLISAERLNLRNYWSGSWRNTFEVVPGDAASATLTGKLKLYVHYFEDGNVQMHSEKEFTTAISFADADSFGAAACDSISKFEDSIQGALEEMYVNMTTETFKDMRRVMPITKTKMNWNVNAHQMVKNLVGGKK